ncbi:hypothetical protein J2W97_002395 [Paenibacillus jamilae]|nr:hypothetical protein [Paenibacillus jamilae]
MVDKMTQDMVNMVKGMSETHAKETLASMFAIIQNEGHGGRTKEQTYKAIVDVYRKEIAAPTIFRQNKEE